MTIKHRKSTSRFFVYAAGATVFLSACAPIGRAVPVFRELGGILQGTPYVTATPSGLVKATATAVSVVSATPLPSATTAAATATSVAAVIGPTAPPPPGYPKDQPWPPVAPTRVVRTPVEMTPTPDTTGAGGAVPPPPAVVQTVSNDAARFIGAFRLVFPSSIGLTGKSQLRVAKLNQAENTPVAFEANFPLDVSTVTGVQLVALLPSPDGQQLIAETASHVASEFSLINTNSRVLQTLNPVAKPGELLVSPIRFLGWATDSQRIIVQNNDEDESKSFALINLVDQKSQIIEYPVSASGLTRVAAMAYSPDGSQFADLLLQPDTFTLELALRPAQNVNLTDRKVIKQLPNVASVVERSLQWSADNKKVAWVMNTQTATKYQLSSQQTELWVADVTTGDAKRVAVLGRGVSYNHAPLWTLGSKELIAVVVENVVDQRDVANNIKRFAIDGTAVKNLTDFKSTRISNLTWTRDNRNLAFSVLKEGSLVGEIWFTDFEGVSKQKLVSATPPNAPFVWLP
ncbi:MAG: hypothetical protein KIH69_014660 [Anaerolineae bacterium]|nr:hypothetical protein [Anaerolineae bacterium]